MVLFTMRLLFVVLCSSLLISACAGNEQCERLAYDNKHGLNVVFFPDGYGEQEADELAHYAMESILAKEPFTSKPFINFYRVKNDDPSICVEGVAGDVIGGFSHDPLAPLDCDIARVKELVNQCNIPKGKIIVLTNETVAAQTSLGFHESGVMFLDMKNQPPEIIQHEFGHFFGLVDEKVKLYSFALGPGWEPAPNCVTSLDKAELQWRWLYPAEHEFERGCAGNPDWYKPEYPVLMSEFPDPSWNYGVFNEWYLGQVLDCCYARTPPLCHAFFSAYPAWTDCRAESH